MVHVKNKTKNMRNARPNARTKKSKSIKTNGKNRKRESKSISGVYQALAERRTKCREATQESMSIDGNKENL